MDYEAMLARDGKRRELAGGCGTFLVLAAIAVASCGSQLWIAAHAVTALFAAPSAWHIAAALLILNAAINPGVQSVMEKHKELLPRCGYGLVAQWVAYGTLALFAWAGALFL
jgi:hypothetical protein